MDKCHSDSSHNLTVSLSLSLYIYIYIYIYNGVTDFHEQHFSCFEFRVFPSSRLVVLPKLESPIYSYILLTAGYTYIKVINWFKGFLYKNRPVNPQFFIDIFTLIDQSVLPTVFDFLRKIWRIKTRKNLRNLFPPKLFKIHF